jgi:hypothetical protein
MVNRKKPASVKVKDLDARKDPRGGLKKKAAKKK